LSGDYELANGMIVRLSRRGSELLAQAADQRSFVLGHDTAGDFYPLEFDAVLRPARSAEGWTFTWIQGGGALPARRVSERVQSLALQLSAAQLAEYAGVYPLLRGFALTVTARGDKLFVQGTDQPATAVVAVQPDVFVFSAAGAEFRFERDAAGKVIALTLLQRGQQLRGARQ
jgi:hypothetical protein